MEMKIEEILKEYKRYVEVMAYSFQQPEHFDDLVGAGNIGLWYASQRFNPDLGKPFITYASIWVKKMMKEHLTKYVRTIHVPANKIKDTSIPTLSLNTPVGENGSILEDFIPEVEQEDATDVSLLKRAVIKLKQKHQEVLVMHYGLGETQPHTQKEIAYQLGISRQAVNERIIKAQAALKVIMHG